MKQLKVRLKVVDETVTFEGRKIKMEIKGGIFWIKNGKGRVGYPLANIRRIVVK